MLSLSGTMHPIIIRLLLHAPRRCRKLRQQYRKRKASYCPNLLLLFAPLQQGSRRSHCPFDVLQRPSQSYATTPSTDLPFALSVLPNDLRPSFIFAISAQYRTRHATGCSLSTSYLPYDITGTVRDSSVKPSRSTSRNEAQIRISSKTALSAAHHLEFLRYTIQQRSA